MITPTQLTDRDSDLMSQAVALARKGLYTTKPNPRVGCVIIQDHTIVGQGWHEKAGEPHAEIHALRNAGVRARGAEVFVSLEPCAHQGRTGPCAQALIDAGVQRVVSAMGDPNPKVAGRGHRMLEQAGIEVILADDELGARELNSGFCRRMEAERPLVRLKVAATMDGRTAAWDGSSQWITSEEARNDAHRLRARSCAVVSGIGTIRADNPRLNARLDEPVVQPLRVVLVGRSQVDPAARLFSVAGPVLIVGSDENQTASEFDQRTERVCLRGSGGQVDLNQLLDLLAARHCNEVLVEAGAAVAGAFVSGGLVDEVWVYQSPDVLGSGGRGMFVMPGIGSIDDRLRFELSDVCQIGRDLRLVYRPLSSH
ncbi:MAG: bifunctional diaminohydroxyphosphoribosylaminopyrimidine deaminase/5-amino-6-(5-phosphoribosylamino)uracil reductase RibD [Arenicellales bacterium]|mgnify:FL=1|nr:bifunctional diaminohydroxyphosphoribosylaminopyrimidine deaminase/5-amino-6-(5-phosphoribosylamino)uracil reductase RibD [Arenicellales bacterium]MDP6291349.1 bifunctional diaminohydroxyphosphoribosylaminopyrimidine deaminase/5-amino-6-(5-phosphoribosylamino)uracil reductase RibD [Arenicellales bacterium]